MTVATPLSCRFAKTIRYFLAGIVSLIGSVAGAEAQVALVQDVVIDSAGVPRNYSFTIETATANVQKDFPSAVPAAAEVPSGVTVVRDLCYRKIGGRQLRLDLCLPAHSSTRPVPGMILVHGGGWRSGDRWMESPMALQLAGRGYVAAIVEYRLSPEALYPAAVLDLKAAVRWMRVHAKEYGVDTMRIGVYGCSSGGHLASLLGVTNSESEYEEGEYLRCSSAVQAVVDIDGPLDLTHPAESGKDADPARPSAAKSWLGYAYAERPDLWRKASPVTHLHAGMPPMLFVNSSLPRFHVGRDTAIDTLTRHGIYNEVHTLPNTPHPFWMFRPWQPEVVRYVTEFLDKVLKNR